MKKKCLITGATGFVGSNLVKALNKEYEIYYVGKDNENKIEGINICDNFQDIQFVSELKNLNVLFHFAAITDTLELDRKKVLQNNTYDSIDLFIKAIEAKTERIVYASSCAVYGNVNGPFREDGPFNPLNPYAESKLLLDRVASKLNSDTKIIGLRYSNIYGPGEGHKKHYKSMVSKIINNFRENKNTELFEFGEQKRDFIYIDDITRLNILAAESVYSGILNAGSGTAISFNEIFEIVKTNFNKELNIEYINNPLKNSYQNLTICDMNLTKKYLNFDTKDTINSGIYKLINYI